MVARKWLTCKGIDGLSADRTEHLAGLFDVLLAHEQPHPAHPQRRLVPFRIVGVHDGVDASGLERALGELCVNRIEIRPDYNQAIGTDVSVLVSHASPPAEASVLESDLRDRATTRATGSVARCPRPTGSVPSIRG